MSTAAQKDYSGTPLPTKLGIREGSRVLLISPPPRVPSRPAPTRRRGAPPCRRDPRRGGAVRHEAKPARAAAVGARPLMGSVGEALGGLAEEGGEGPDRPHVRRRPGGRALGRPA